MDLLARPLAAKLQACDSPSNIPIVLQQQIQFKVSHRSNEMLTKSLDPTVKVLFAFSETLGEGAGLVGLEARGLVRVLLPHTVLLPVRIPVLQIFPPAKVFFAESAESESKSFFYRVDHR